MAVCACVFLYTVLVSALVRVSVFNDDDNNSKIEKKETKKRVNRVRSGIWFEQIECLKLIRLIV